MLRDKLKKNVARITEPLSKTTTDLIIQESKTSKTGFQYLESRELILQRMLSRLMQAFHPC